MTATLNRRLAGILGAAVLTIGLAVTVQPATGLANSMSASPEKSAAGMEPASAPADLPVVGGAAMYPTKNIVQNASESKDHTTLVAAVKAADLVKTLSGKGPFTVFAPTNAAFDKLPEGTVDTLLKPENKKKLSSILTYHVVPGKLTAAELDEKAEKGKGKVMLKTVEGGTITLEKSTDGKWWILDNSGGKAEITQADVMQSNGVIFVIDTVLMPKMKS